MEKHLNILNKFGDIPVLEKFIEQIAGEWQLSAETCNELMLAAEEIVSNIINYGFPDIEEERAIQITFTNDMSIIRMVFMDDGLFFNPIARANPDSIDKPLEEREAGGLGIFFVKEMMDHVEYHHDGFFNILTVEKKLSSDQQANTN